MEIQAALTPWVPQAHGEPKEWGWQPQQSLPIAKSQPGTGYRKGDTNSGSGSAPAALATSL